MNNLLVLSCWEPVSFWWDDDDACFILKTSLKIQMGKVETVTRKEHSTKWQKDKQRSTRHYTEN